MAFGADAIDTSQPSLIEAKIQSYVAQFLASKEKLLNLQNSTNPDIASKAKSLMANQVDLEGQMPNALALASNIKTGAYSITDFVTLGDFAYKITQHINAVNGLEKQASGIPVVETSMFGSLFGAIPPTVKTVGMLAGAGVAVWFLFGRK